jgi:hypothetical protein
MTPETAKGSTCGVKMTIMALCGATKNAGSVLVDVVTCVGLRPQAAWGTACDAKAAACSGRQRRPRTQQRARGLIADICEARVMSGNGV